jgi:hypothetical protein
MFGSLFDFIGNIFNPPPNPVEVEAERARKEEEARQAEIAKGQSSIADTFAQFDPAFFDGLSRSFVDYARPQLDEQFGDANEQLTYGLARAGTLDSSSRVNRESDLRQTYDTQLQSIADQGIGYATEAEKAVEDARSSLTSTLNATGDASAASQGALSQAQILSTPPTYSPLGQLFTDATATLEQQAALERAMAATGGAITPRFNTGLFAPSTSAVRVNS